MTVCPARAGCGAGGSEGESLVASDEACAFAGPYGAPRGADDPRPCPNACG